MIIKEFLPNPVGSDKEGEYIKLLNDGQEAVLLNGWSVKDAAGKTYNLSDSLPAGRELILPYSQTKIFLNNNGEEVFLYNAGGELIDRLNYSGQTEEGQVIVKQSATNELITGDLRTGKIETSATDSSVVFLGILIAIILAVLGLYIIKKLEKKMGIKLW